MLTTFIPYPSTVSIVHVLTCIPAWHDRALETFDYVIIYIIAQ